MRSDDAPRWEEVQSIVDRALDLPLDERASFIAISCGADDQLRDETARLLAACQSAAGSAGFLAGTAPEFASPLVDANTERESSSLLLAASDGRYVVERQLARGGMATVYLARDERHDRAVAIKVLPKHDMAVRAERFVREIRTTARLSHPHLLSLYDSGEAQDFLYYVMPYVEGETLRARLTRVGALPMADTVRLVREIADALAYAHRRGVVHRDLKPENVLLSGGHAVVADFGIAEALETATLGQDAGKANVADANVNYASAAFGTPAYMAPEQGSSDADHRSDLYALGLIAYEMTTGRHPFEKRSPREMIEAHRTEEPVPAESLRADVPQALARLIRQLLEKDPQNRPQGASEVIESLEGLPLRQESRPWFLRGIPVTVVFLFVIATAAYLLRDPNTDGRGILTGTGLTDASRDKNLTPARGTMKQEAYDAYLKGRYFMQARGLANVSRAIEHFKDAIRYDAEFAQAHAALSIAYVVLPVYLPGAVDSALPRVVAHAKQAVALDSLSAESRLAAASALDFQLQPRAALPHYRKAVALEPSSVDARYYLGANLLTLGHTEEAIAELRRGTLTDPAAKSLAGAYAFALWAAGRNEDARDAIERALRIDTTFVLNRIVMSFILVSLGEADSAVSVLQAPASREARNLRPSALLYAYAAAGRWGEAARVRPQLRSSADSAFAELIFGNEEPLVRLLSSAKGQRSWQDSHFVLGCHPFLDPIRDNARFQMAMRNLGVQPCPSAQKWPLAAPRSG